MNSFVSSFHHVLTSYVAPWTSSFLPASLSHLYAPPPPSPTSTASPSTTESTMSRDVVENGAPTTPSQARPHLQSQSGSQPESQSQSHPQSQADRLALLPDKLLLLIFDMLAHENRHAICNVSILNRKYHALADRILYRSILFESPEHHLIFSESLDRRPRRGSMIENIKLEYPSSELSHLILDSALDKQSSTSSNTFRKGVDGLSRALASMSNLETLDIAVPVKLLHGIGALFNGPFDLAGLKTCSLFYQCPDNGYWDLRENIHIFTHPTLETLVIRRARLDERGFDFMERPHSTALKSLHLIECDINDDSLADIMEFPEGLREFYLYHTADPAPELEESSDEISEHVMALRDQAETIESITIDHPTLAGRKVLRLRDFQAVKYLRLNRDTQLFGKTGRKPRLHSAGLPPRLEVLEFTEPLGADETVTELFAMMLQNIEFMARELRALIVVEGPGGVPEQILEACKGKKFELDIRQPEGGDGEANARRPPPPLEAPPKTAKDTARSRHRRTTQDTAREPLANKERVRWNALSEEAWSKRGDTERKPFDPA
ncbi:F-box domain-containing protein [Diaporthe amygdali]|uniref:F-box domain-containing protein n=1 Tax=Phomopsis amygdali TaxID=1214568 RepID=UPI0022FE878F|nr:F-box domain-containing protein [Diaporthe amygdali]KAJ0121964.1 F-box domain-containing protein [Diaporthe amygdali]